MNISVHDVDEYRVLMMMNLRFSYEYKVLWNGMKFGFPEIGFSIN